MFTQIEFEDSNTNSCSGCAREYLPHINHILQYYIMQNNFANHSIIIRRCLQFAQWCFILKQCSKVTLPSPRQHSTRQHNISRVLNVHCFLLKPVNICTDIAFLCFSFHKLCHLEVWRIKYIDVYIRYFDLSLYESSWRETPRGKHQREGRSQWERQKGLMDVRTGGFYRREKVPKRISSCTTLPGHCHSFEYNSMPLSLPLKDHWACPCE